MELSYLHTASVPPLTKGLLFSVPPGSKPHWNSSGLPWLPGYLSHDDAQKWPNLEPLPLSSLFIPFQDNEEPHPSIWLVSEAPPQPIASWGLRHHNVPLCPSTWASGCRGRPFYNFSTADTSVCLILGSGDSGARCFSSWASNFLSVPFILWLICATSTLLPPSSLYKDLPNPFCPTSAFQSNHFISRPPSASWGFLRPLRNFRAST